MAVKANLLSLEYCVPPNDGKIIPSPKNDQSRFPTAMRPRTGNARMVLMDNYPDINKTASDGEKKISPEAGKTKTNKKHRKRLQTENTELIGMLDSALDEDISAISELSEVSDSDSGQGTSSRNSSKQFIVGLFVIIMSLVGIVSTISALCSWISDIVNNTKQKDEFAQFIYPVVICDPAPFGDSVRMKNEMVISAAVWDIILYENHSKYETDFDYIIVPEVDVEQHAAKLFGTGLSIEHTTISSIDVSFYYDESISSYRVPSNPKYFTYSPEITEIIKESGKYTLTVGYLSPTPSWLAQISDEAPSPEKYVEYELTESASGYTITAIRQTGLPTDIDF